MNKIIIFILLMSSIIGCSQQQNKQKITINTKSILIDVRTAQEYGNGHLQKAINIPYTEIKEKIVNVTKDTNQKIIVYCKSGRRSGIAKKILNDMGYRNVINAGGYEKLKKNQRQ